MLLFIYADHRERVKQTCATVDMLVVGEVVGRVNYELSNIKKWSIVLRAGRRKMDPFKKSMKFEPQKSHTEGLVVMSVIFLELLPFGGTPELLGAL